MTIGHHFLFYGYLKTHNSNVKISIKQGMNEQQLISHRYNNTSYATTQPLAMSFATTLADVVYSYYITTRTASLRSIIKPSFYAVSVVV